MVSRSDPTVLRLVGIGVMPYSAAGLKQTLEPIAEAQQIERTINGELLNLSYDAMQKYKSTISGSDVRGPAVDGVWPGKRVTVDCIATLSFDNNGSNTFQRTPVDYETAVWFEAGFCVYRPQLEMMVMSFTLDEDEYGSVVGWRMDLEEI